MQKLKQLLVTRPLNWNLKTELLKKRAIIERNDNEVQERISVDKEKSFVNGLELAKTVLYYRVQLGQRGNNAEHTYDLATML